MSAVGLVRLNQLAGFCSPISNRLGPVAIGERPLRRLCSRLCSEQYGSSGLTFCLTLLSSLINKKKKKKNLKEYWLYSGVLAWNLVLWTQPGSNLVCHSFPTPFSVAWPSCCPHLLSLTQPS